MKLSKFNLQCRRIHVLLWDYVANLLSSEDRQTVETHLSRCNSCTKEMTSISKLQKMLHSERMRPLPAHRHNFNEVQRALIVENYPARKNFTLIASMCTASAAVAALLTFGAMVPLRSPNLARIQAPVIQTTVTQDKPEIASVPHTIIKKVYVVRTIVKKPSEIELAAAYNQALLNLAIQHPELAGLRSHFDPKSGSANLLTSYNHKIAMNNNGHVNHELTNQSHNSAVVMMPVQHVTHYTTTILEPAVYDSTSTY